MICRLLLFVLLAVQMPAQRLSDLRTPLPLPESETLVIGFLGSWENWDDSERGVRKLVLRLRGIPGVHAESVGNHKRAVALDLVKQAFDRDRNGVIDSSEAARARLIVFGQSLGGSATVKLARDLESWGLPVLLTVQVDSVGIGDEVIPANVMAAANFYQRGLLTFRGESEIRAADPQKTKILGNFRWHDQFVYRLLPGQRWRRTFGGGHARMELDPLLWAQVEGFIRGSLN